MGMKLFDEEGDDDISNIDIDKDYACRFEHNKKREDFQRYQELKKKGVIDESDEQGSQSDDDSSSSSSSSSDSSGRIKPSKDDLHFFNALIKIKNRDPSLKRKDVKLFEYDESEEKDEKGRSELNEQKEKNKEVKKKKPKYLKDVVATHLIEEGPELEDEDVDDRKKSYNEEQEEIKKEFLDAVEEFGNDEGYFLKQKETGNENEEAYDNDDDGEFAKKLDEYFGGDGELDDSQTFLKEFFRNKMWVDKEKKDNRVVIDDEEVDEVLRDEEEIEMQEEYESNFRYEENVGDRVMGHSRRVEGSVRKKENARKDQRKSKENRM
ncbi:hypothetical protein CFOL_v3_00304 [Cephalotus follicularis]|uniref:Uncharacterized protein n=1 Tax=Cephalotus follicularis TaxID=3775 RepID=A0A1Q3AMH8_CEPFO|nr:hypothetical protein CFOL_v3_00304 [Cephalotus follicularis]